MQRSCSSLVLSRILNKEIICLLTCGAMMNVELLIISPIMPRSRVTFLDLDATFKDRGKIDLNIKSGADLLHYNNQSRTPYPRIRFLKSSFCQKYHVCIGWSVIGMMQRTLIRYGCRSATRGGPWIWAPPPLSRFLSSILNPLKYLLTARTSWKLQSSGYRVSQFNGFYTYLEISLEIHLEDR